MAIPVRSFAAGNSRLRIRLDAGACEQLTRALTARAVTAAQALADEVVMVTTSDAVTRWARHEGLMVIAETGKGLDSAASAAVDHARRRDLPWLILHSDLPLLTSAALSPVVSALRSAVPVISPSYDGGTAVIGGTGDFTFSYGPASFHAHLARNPQARVIVDHRLAIDIDTYRDLDITAQLPGGAWLQPLLGSPA